MEEKKKGKKKEHLLAFPALTSKSSTCKHVVTICHGNYRAEVYSCMNFSVGEILQGLL